MTSRKLHRKRSRTTQAAKVSRRTVLTGMASAAAATLVAPARAQTQSTSSAAADAIVIGAGVFGAWTAWHLRQAGKRVLLVDAWGPAHARASSGGESRMTRTAYGRDEIYTRFAWESLEQWRWLSSRAGLPIFHPVGVLFFFHRVEPYVTQTLEVHRRLQIPFETLDRPTLQRRFPQVNWEGVEIAMYEPDRGALMARRAVQTLVKEFVAAGGEYRQVAIAPPTAGNALTSIKTSTGEQLRADQFVFACGPWLPKVFPGVLGSRIFPTRQEVFFFAPASGDSRFAPGQLPGWADFNEGDIYYGFPDLEARGFKIAHDQHGPAIDPDVGDRMPSADALEDVREFMRRRFPDLAKRPLVEARVCQYENSSNGDLLIDRHPTWQNTWLVGAGSGHGFKHGPAVGKYAAQRMLNQSVTVEPRFSLQSKATEAHRDVH
jgi:sarcosine oxidase